MASSSADQMFSIFWTKESSGQRFYLNFLSDSRREGPIKLPDKLIRHLSTGAIDLDIIERAKLNEEIMFAISCSLDALYGNGMPRIYLADNQKHLVMDVFIHEGHSRLFRKLPLSPLMMIQVNFILFKIIHRRIQDVVEDPELGPVKLPRIEFNKRCVPTGRRARKEEICSLILGPLSDPKDLQLRSIPTHSINLGDPLVYCGCEFTRLGRSFYINIKADNQKGSIKLPEAMLKLASMSRIEARRASEESPNNIFKMDLVWNCLEKLHEVQAPVVYFVEGSNNLVVNVPLDIEHAPLLSKCLLGCYRANLFGTILHYYKDYFCNEVQQVDNLVYRDLNMPGLFGPNTHQPTGREATREEVYSVLFEKKNLDRQTNSDHLPLTPEMLDEICNLIMRNMNAE